MNKTAPANNTAELTSGATTPWWFAAEEPLSFEALTEDITIDVVIVGAGIAGLSVAYCLVQEGKKVVVIEDGKIGSGESGRTSAHLVTALDNRYYKLKDYYGIQQTALAAESHSVAIDLIEEIVTKEKIECGFKRVKGYLFLDPSDTLEHLKQEYAVLQEVGLPVKWLNFVPNFPSGSGPCIEFEQQAQFHPLKYLHGLAKAIIKKGGKIYCSTRSSDINEHGVTTEKNTIKAKHIVVATNSPINDRYAIHYKQYPYRTYMIAGLVPKGSVSASLWWDTGNQNTKWHAAPYHYLRTDAYDETHDVLLCGGEDHRTGQSEDSITEGDRFKRLYTWAKERFPQLGKPIYSWSGQVEEPLDMLAYIGRNPGDENIYIITGDSGNGLTHGTIGGMLIRDLILKRKNPWEELYDPSRKTLRTVGAAIKELGAATMQYLGDLISRDSESLKSIGKDDGGIIGIGTHKVAVYKDAKGKVHAFSGICPHQKCILEWNGVEKSFDCPCHGSRFSAEGTLVNGPAIADLEAIPLEEISE